MSVKEEKVEIVRYIDHIRLIGSEGVVPRYLPIFGCKITSNIEYLPIKQYQIVSNANKLSSEHAKLGVIKTITNGLVPRHNNTCVNDNDVILLTILLANVLIKVE